MSSVFKINESTGRSELNEIDRSARGPALVFIAAGTLWLIVSTCLALIASFKLHTPDFLGQCEIFTYGRVYPAATNTFIYGWGINIGLAVGLWIMARLSHSKIHRNGSMVVAAVFWNIGVLLGTVGILKGDSLGVGWMEFPSYVMPLLFIAYLVIGVAGVSIFRHRATKQSYVSQWLILAAFFSFPWLSAVAQLMLVCEPTRGVMQSITSAWYMSSLNGLWFIALGLAGLYYMVPKVLGSRFHYYKLMSIGFWSLIVSTSFSGGSY
ncbi:MAG: cbb3-type cytochrome c oxidase subunit I, partial [Opitutaceae bacterium]|nr:cbb3-type cytochrome c oxidase subunit I [Opitutaceae bacterium]